MTTYLYHKQGTSHTIHQVRALHPRTMMPDNADLADLGYQRIAATPQPPFDPVREAVRELAPVDGAQAWQVYPLPPEVTAANEVQEAFTALQAAKATRQAAVDSITVLTQAGHVFDGDEVSQGRMARAILVLQATQTETTRWVLANNTVVQVTVADLTEALALAGAEQTRLWPIQGVHQA